jgi:hypothetical protein
MTYEIEPNLNPHVPSRTRILQENPDGTLGDKVFRKFNREHEARSWSLEAHFQALEAPTFDPRGVDPRIMAGIEATALVESHNPVYAEGLFNYNRRDHRETGFLSIWTYEEFKHYKGEEEYLIAASRFKVDGKPLVDLKHYNEKLRATREGQWGRDESAVEEIEASIYTDVQELLTGHGYQSMAMQVSEPVLRQLLMNMAKDEFAHHGWAHARSKRLLQSNGRQDQDQPEVNGQQKKPMKVKPEDLDPNAVSGAKRVLQGFEMPGKNHIPENERNGEIIFKAINPGPLFFKPLIDKVEDLVGIEYVLEWLEDREFYDSLLERGIPSAVIEAYRAKNSDQIGVKAQAAANIARGLFGNLRFGR